MEVAENVDKRLLQLRNFFKLNQTEFAQKVDVSRSNYSNWEAGKGPLPRLSTLRRIANATGCSFMWLAYAKGELELSLNDKNNTSAADAVAILRDQLHKKDAEISWLHSVINKLLQLEPVPGSGNLGKQMDNAEAPVIPLYMESPALSKTGS